jgi:1,4-alpha-glucan branching enzyme
MSVTSNQEPSVITVLPTGQIQFRFFRRDVQNVCIVGTFNQWRENQTPMEDLGDGWWGAELSLDDGLHQFRYRADGEWFTDFAAHGVEHSKWGMNSMAIVGRASIAA